MMLSGRARAAGLVRVGGAGADADAHPQPERPLVLCRAVGALAVPSQPRLCVALESPGGAVRMSAVSLKVLERVCP